MPGIPAFSACVWLPGVLTCFISLGGHIRPQSGADTPPACCTARKCDIRPQRKFARSKVLKIAFIVVCSLPFKISTSAFPLTYQSGWYVCIITVLPPTVNPFQQKSAKKVPPPEFRQAGQSILACYRILFHITHQTGQSQADLRHIGDQHQHSKNRGKIGD